MKKVAGLYLLLMITYAPNSVFGQDSLYQTLKLSKFEVHLICTDNTSPYPFAVERYILNKSAPEKTLNGFAHIVGIEGKMKYMNYYITDGYTRIYERRFIKDGDRPWFEINERSYDLFEQYLDDFFKSENKNCKESN